MATVSIIIYSYNVTKEMLESVSLDATQGTTEITAFMKQQALATAIDELELRAHEHAMRIEHSLHDAIGIASTLANALGVLKAYGIAVDVGRDSV